MLKVLINARVDGGCKPFLLTHLVHHLLAVIGGEGADVEMGGGAWKESLSQPATVAPPGVQYILYKLVVK